MRKIDPEVALEVAARLQDWIPLSDARALTWAADMLGAAPTEEQAIDTARRINDAARAAARASRDVRYHDVFSGFTALLKRERQASQAAQQDLERKALPPITGGTRTGVLSVGIYGDIAEKVLRAADYETELEKRRGMTDEQIAARRAELRERRTA